MPKRKRRIKKAIVSHISLCPKGANGLPTMFKADDTDGSPSSRDIESQLETLIRQDNLAPSERQVKKSHCLSTADHPKG